jgi:threonine/homoserine/homoserine lactone efflux protein
VQFPIPTRYPEYLLAAVLIILAPGPSVLFAIARAIAWGRATAIATVAGNALGMFSLSILIAFGLGPILERSELAFILELMRSVIQELMPQKWLIKAISVQVH